MESRRVACCMALVFWIIVSPNWLSPQVGIEAPRLFCVICGQNMVTYHVPQFGRKCEEFRFFAVGG